MLKKHKPYRIIEETKDILVGRKEGGIFAEKVLKELQQLEPDSILPIDFNKISLIDFSYADEFLTKVMRRIMSGELGTRYIILQGMSPTVEENIGAVFTIRQFVCPKMTKDGKVDLVGKIGTELVDTYRLAVKKGKLTARDVGEIAPHVGVSAISNRLTKLQKLGLLMRTMEVGVETGGRQYVYEPVC